MVDFGLESLDLHLKSSNIFLLFEREGLGLQDFSLLREKVLIQERDLHLGAIHSSLGMISLTW